MKREKFDSFIIILFLLLGCGAQVSFHTENKNPNIPNYVAIEPDNVPEDYPRIIEMKKIATTISLNEQGFWQAELTEGLVFIYVPEGEFIMGSNFGLNNELPIRRIHLDGFWMSKYPVTVGQFRRFVVSTGHVTDAEKGQGSWQWSNNEQEWIPQKDGNWKNTYFKQGEDHPVVSISWNDAQAYTKWLSNKLEYEIKLATAAQFEKGARGIDGRQFPWGNDKPDGTRANYADINYWQKYGNARHSDKSIDDGFTETSPVGSFPAGASPYGLMDMAGNVWEWNHDIFDHDYYQYMSDYNPSGPKDSGIVDQERENRGGGSWTDRSGHITPKGGHNLRSAARTGDEQNSSDDHLGFRIVIDFVVRENGLVY